MPSRFDRSPLDPSNSSLSLASASIVHS
jgi:hypothetical protein